MIRFASATALAGLLTLSLALPACTATADEGVEGSEAAIIQLPTLEVSPTVRAFQTDPTAKRELSEMKEIEKRNEAKRAEHDAAVGNARAKLDAAKAKVKVEKREWKAIAPKKRCWLFFKCTDYTNATEYHAAQDEVRALKGQLHSLPSLNLEPVEPIGSIIDRVAKEHDRGGYAKVAPINGDLALLERPASAHAAHIKDVQAAIKSAIADVQARQTRLDKLGEAPADAEVEESIENQTEALETKLDDVNLDIRGLGDTFFVLQAALRNDENYRNQTFPSLPGAIDSSLTNFPNELSDRDAQAKRSREILDALNRVAGNLESHRSGLEAHERDVAESRRDALDWLTSYISKTETQIRRF